MPTRPGKRKPARVPARKPSSPPRKHPVVSLTLDPENITRLDALAQKRKTDRSTLARQIFDEFFSIQEQATPAQNTKRKKKGPPRGKIT